MKKPLTPSKLPARENKDLPERPIQKNAPAENMMIADNVLMKLIRDAVVTLDADFHIQHWNHGAEEMYGWKEEEVIGKISYQLFDTDFGSASIEVLKEELATKGYFRRELIHRTKNGEKIFVHNSASAIRDEAGALSGLIMIIKNISDRKKREAEIAYNAALLDNIRDAIISLDKEFRITKWNKGAEEIYGWTENEAKGKIVYELLNTNFGGIPIDKLLDNFRNKGYFDGELTHITKAGKIIYAHLSSSPISDADGNFSGMISIVKDITEMKKAEKKLNELTENLQEQVTLKTRELTNLFERVTEGFVAFDKYWNIVFINKRAGDLFGREPDELMGKHMWTEFPEAIGLPFYKAYHKAMETQVYLHLEDYYAPYNRWYENNIYPSPEGVSVYFKDITDKKNAEEKLTKANRLYHFISSINQMIIRTSDEMALFKEACRIAVDIGRFKMAWIGILDPVTKLVKPVIYDGLDLDYLKVIRVIADKNLAEGKGPSGRALEEGKTQLCNDISSDPRMKPWHEEARKRGYHSSIAIPIRRFDKVIGVFTLYAATVNFFDEQEIILLEGATNDISFAINFLENELIRKKAQESLLKSERRYQTLTEVAPGGIFHTNKDGLFTYVNPQWCQMSGLLKTDASGHGWLNAVHEDERETLAKSWLETLLSKKSSKFEFRFKHKDGRIVWVIAHVLPEKNSENQVIGFVGTTTDITDRKKNEEELIRIYEEKQTVLNRINDGMVSLDKEWRYTFLNDAALATHPKTREETLGKTIWEIHPELSGTAFEKMYREAMITQKVTETENYYAPMNIWFSAKAYPSSDGLTIFYKDITERKKAEEAIQKANKQLTLSQKIARIGYWEMDLIAHTNYWSDEMYQLYELDNTGTVINPEIFFKRIHQDDKELVKTRIKSLIIDGERFEDLEYKFLTKDGTIRYMLSTGESITNDSGRPIRAYGTMQDITERKKVQLAFIKEKQLSDSIIDNLPGIFYIYNKEGKFIQWNKNFESVTQFSTDEIQNMRRLDFVPVAQRKDMSQTISRTFLSDKESLLSYFLTKKGEQIPYYLTGMSIEYQGEPCLMVIGIDFSERARIQEEMKKTSRQLQDLTNHLQTIREEERKRIGRELHDELGQQLTAMKMDISWINKKMPEEDELIRGKMKEVIELLDGSNASLRRILNELRPTILDQHGLLDALHWHARQFTVATGIPLEIRTSEKEIRVKDEIATCIFRLFQESLTNITRYAEAKKVVTFIEIIMGNIIIEIEDDGKGFDTVSEQPKSRQPFGILGMRERVRALNGKFELISSSGKGTKIHISLPLQ